MSKFVKDKKSPVSFKVEKQTPKDFKSSTNYGCLESLIGFSLLVFLIIFFISASSKIGLDIRIVALLIFHFFMFCMSLIVSLSDLLDNDPSNDERGWKNLFEHESLLHWWLLFELGIVVFMAIKVGFHPFSSSFSIYNPTFIQFIVVFTLLFCLNFLMSLILRSLKRKRSQKES